MSPGALGLAVAYVADAPAAPKVFHFDGTARLAQTFSAEAPFPAAALTLSLWLRTTASSGTIAAYAGATGSALTIAQPSALEVRLDATTVATGVALADGRWHHLAVTLARSGRTRRALSVFLDAQLVHRTPGALAASAGGLAPDGTLTLGAGLVADAANLQLWSGAQEPLALLTTYGRRLETATSPGLVLSWWLESLTTEGPNAVDSFAVPSPPLRWRAAADAAGWVIARWQADGTSDYVLQAISGDGSWFDEQTTRAGSAALPGVLLGRPYELRVGRAGAGFDEPVALLPLDLSAPVVAMSWPARLTASWQPVDQAGAYGVGVAGTSGGVVTTTSTDLLDAHLADAAPVVLGVRAQLAATLGTAGPAADPGALDAPAGGAFLYDAGFGAGALVEASWPAQAVPAEFLVAEAAGATAHAPAAAGALTVGLSAPPAPGAQLACSLRAVRPCVLGTRAVQTIAVTDLGGAPLLEPLQLDPTGQTVTIGWTWSTSWAPSASYRVSILLDGVEQGPIVTSATTAGWTAPPGRSGSLVTIRVRAIAVQNLGRWSTAETFTVGSTLRAPSVQSACVGSDLTITATWTAVPGAQSYLLTLTCPSDPSFSRTREVTGATTTDWPPAQSGVSARTQYTLTATARAGSADGPASAPFPFSTATQCSGSDPELIGEPINQVTGQYLYAHTDLAVPGVVPLQLVTAYSSPLAGQAPGPSPLGPYWGHSYDVRLTVAGTVATIAFGDGSPEQRFTVPAALSGLYPKLGPPNGDALVRSADGSYALTRRDGSVYAFDGGGVLQTIARRDGNVLAFAYAGGRLTQVRDRGSGRALTFAYDASGRLEQVACGTLTVRYAYDPATGDLTRVTNAAGAHRDLTYATGSLLLSATDENGHTFVTNVYGGDRRIETQRTPRGTLRLSYLDGTDANGFATVTTTALDAAGCTTTYVASPVTQQIAWELRTLTQTPGGAVQLIGRTFDGANRVVTQTVYEGPPPSAFPPAQMPAGNTTTYGYDAAGNLTSTTAPTGETESAVYNADGTLQSSTDPAGNTTTLTWRDGLLRQVDEPLGHRTTFGYADAGNARNLLQSIAVYPGNAGVDGAVPNVTTLAYDATGALEAVTHPLGEVESFTSDAALGWPTGRTVSAPGPVVLLRETIAPIAANGLPEAVRTQWGAQTAAQGFVTRRGYDALGALTSLTDPLGNATTYGWTDDGLLATVTQPALAPTPAQVTSYAYDGLGHVERIVYALAPRVATACVTDPLGRLRASTDANGRTTTIDWTMLAAPSGTTAHALRRTTTFPRVAGASGSEQFAQTFDPLGRLLAVTNVTLAEAQATAPARTYAYAAAAGRVTVTETLPPPQAGGTASTVVTTLDARGRPLQVVDERGKTWTATYDTVTEGGVTYERARRVDPLGNVELTWTDPLGRAVRRQVLAPAATAPLTDVRVAYDALGRVAGVTELGADGAWVTPTTFAYAYDAASGSVRVSVSPYGGPASVYAFDGAGRWTGSVDGGGRGVALAYQPSGLLAAVTDGRAQRTAYGYDAAGRLTRVTPPAGAAAAIEHVLDANGNRLETLVGGTAAIVRTFDERNRELTRRDVAAGELVSTAWWPGGLLRTLGYPGLATPVGYTWDALGRLATVTDWNGAVTRYSWLATGQLAGAALPGGLTAERAVDDAGRLVAVQTSGADGTVHHAASYTLDAAGRPTAIDRVLPYAPDRPPTSASARTYGGGDRLATIAGQAVASDADGNVTQLPGIAATLAYDEGGRLSRIGATALAYDADGLRRTLPLGAQTLRATWHAAGWLDFAANRGDPVRAVTATEQRPSPTGATLALPATGEPPRAQTLDAGLSRLLAVNDAGGAVLARYVWGVGLIAAVGPSGTSVPAFDALGTTLALVDAATGTITDRYAYDPFGGAIGGEGTTPNPFRLHGQWGVTDTLRGVVSMRARDYAPAALRFLQQDPMFGIGVVPQSLNRYAFVLGDPLRLIDPFGYQGRPQDKRGGLGPIGWTLIGGGVLLLALVGVGIYAYWPELVGGPTTGAGAGAAIEMAVRVPLHTGFDASTPLLESESAIRPDFYWKVKNV